MDEKECADDVEVSQIATGYELQRKLTEEFHGEDSIEIDQN